MTKPSASLFPKPLVGGSIPSRPTMFTLIQPLGFLAEICNLADYL